MKPPFRRDQAEVRVLRTCVSEDEDEYGHGPTNFYGPRAIAIGEWAFLLVFLIDQDLVSYILSIMTFLL